MQIPIITNESLAQMTLIQLTAYVLRLLSEALPHVENVETAETNAQASAAEAAATVNGFDAHAVEKTTAFDAHVVEKTTAFDAHVTTALKSIDDQTTAGLAQINSAVTTVLNTEV